MDKPAPSGSQAVARNAHAGRILVIANPTAGGYRAEVLETLAERLRTAGRNVEIHLTRRAGEIGEICSDPNLAVDILVIAGGDGSINEALTGFEAIVAPPALAVVPFGTANVLACEHRLPRRPGAIADMILRRRARGLHYGIANGRPFVLMVSAGFDAEVVHAIALPLKRKLGKLAYVLTALRVAFSRQRSEVDVVTPEQTVRCRLAVVTNSANYGGPFVLCPQAGSDKPGLWLVGLLDDSIPALLRVGAALLLNRLHKARDIVIQPLETARIMADAPVAAQIDGDPFGTTPLEISSSARSINLIVP